MNNSCEQCRLVPSHQIPNVCARAGQIVSVLGANLTLRDISIVAIQRHYNNIAMHQVQPMCYTQSAKSVSQVNVIYFEKVMINYVKKSIVRGAEGQKYNK